jgi:hypothetical protein
MRERREIPKIEGGEAGVLILGEGMGELLELLQCSLLTHFGDGGRDEGVDGDSLREYLPQEGIQSLVICNKGTETLGFTQVLVWVLAR